jgi:hypothetical protein
MLEELIDHMHRVKRGEERGMVLYDHPVGAVSKLQKMISFGPGRYLIMAGPPGTGKTSYIDTQFVLKPILAWIHRGAACPNYIYRSMERSPLDKIAKLVSAIIQVDQKIVLDPKILLGFSNASRLVTDDDIALVSHYRDYFEVIKKNLDIIPGSASPKQVLDYAVRKAQSRGKLWSTKGRSALVNNQVAGELNLSEVIGGVEKYYMETPWGKLYEGASVFIPDDKSIYIHITDHIGKLVSGNEKTVLDEHSNNMAGTLRDIYRYGVIDVSQLNRGLYDTYRAKNTLLTITMSDLKGTNTTAENADIVLGVINPAAHQIEDYEGYNVGSFINPETNASHLRVIVCAKNSQGPSDFKIGVAFWGENGMTYELPSPLHTTNVDAENTIRGTYCVKI